jgi:hypothetical protein
MDQVKNPVFYSTLEGMANICVTYFVELIDGYGKVGLFTIPFTMDLLTSSKLRSLSFNVRPRPKTEEGPKPKPKPLSSLNPAISSPNLGIQQRPTVDLNGNNIKQSSSQLSPTTLRSPQSGIKSAQ